MAAVLLAGAGYLAFTASPPPIPPSTGVATLNLSTEQLEQVLAERRKADALAAEKRRLEEEARQKAQADAEAKRQADAELEQARQARQQAEEELARLKAEVDAQRQKPADRQDQATASAQRTAEEAQRKAEVEAAALRKAEQEATERAAAEAEAKRQADEALARVEAERRQAEDAARAKAEAEQAALRQAPEDAQRKAAEADSVKQAEQQRLKAEAERAKAEAERQKAEAELKLRAEAEAAEKTLRLDQPARERLQLALTSLGFDTRGSDGIFGPRTRDMIGAWQKVRKDPPTGFLTAAQQQALTREATGTLTTATTPSPNSSPPVAAVPPSLGQPSAAVSTGTMYDGVYSGMLPGAHLRGDAVALINNGRGTLTVTARGCETSRISLTVSPVGLITGGGALNCVFTSALSGPVEISSMSGTQVGQLLLNVTNGHNSVLLRLRAGDRASYSLPSPDGLWRGTYSCSAAIGSNQSTTPAFSFNVEVRLLSGAGSWTRIPGSDPSGTTAIHIWVGSADARLTRDYFPGVGNSPAQTTLPGTYDGNTIRATGRETGSGARECTLTLTKT